MGALLSVPAGGILALGAGLVAYRSWHFYQRKVLHSRSVSLVSTMTYRPASPNFCKSCLLYYVRAGAISRSSSFGQGSDDYHADADTIILSDSEDPDSCPGAPELPDPIPVKDDSAASSGEEDPYKCKGGKCVSFLAQQVPEPREVMPCELVRAQRKSGAVTER